MGVREFDAWCEVTSRQGKRQTTGPDSWDGYESDPFWQAAHATR
jgi:hypothetical protein